MQATIHNIEPFDRTKGTSITFTWNGNQIYKVRCVIKENESNNTVYDTTIDTMKQIFPISANSNLTNGKYYICIITTFDINNIESTQSAGKPFYCYSTPTFKLSLSDNEIVRASTYEVSLSYNQAEREELNYYNISLYSYQKTVLQSSENTYDTSTLSYIISSLENATQYYIRATGETIHGIHLDTGYILFTVAYTQAPLFSILEANNLSDTGGIELRANITSTLGVSEKDVIYIDGTMADLRDNTVTFNVGYELIGDFTQMFAFKKPNLNQCFAFSTDQNETTKIEFYYREGSFNNSDGCVATIELRASSVLNTHYIRFCKYFKIPDESELICFCISRIGNYFDTKAVVVKG